MSTVNNNTFQKLTGNILFQFIQIDEKNKRIKLLKACNKSPQFVTPIFSMKNLRYSFTLREYTFSDLTKKFLTLDILSLKDS